MATLHMLVGIPGSGKSTYTKNYLTKKYPEQVRYIPVQDSLELYDIDTKEDLEKLFLRQNNI